MIKSRDYDLVFTSSQKEALKFPFEDAWDLANKLERKTKLAVDYNHVAKCYVLCPTYGKYLKSWERI